jgi:hypothetical protein
MFLPALDEATDKWVTTNGGDPEPYWNVIKDDPQELLNGSTLEEVVISVNLGSGTLLTDLDTDLSGIQIFREGHGTSTEIADSIGVDDYTGVNLEHLTIWNNGVSHLRSSANIPIYKMFGVKSCEACFRQSDLGSVYLNQFASPPILAFTTAGGNPIYEFTPPGGGGFNPPPPPPPCAEECERDCVNGTENLRRFYANEDYDNRLFQGTGEFVWYRLWSEDVDYSIDSEGNFELSGNPLTYVGNLYENIDEGNPQMYYPDFSYMIWDPVQDGYRQKMILIETDGRKTDRVISPELSVKVIEPTTKSEFSRTIKTDITIQGQDEEVGESIIEYCQDIDPNGFQYNISSNVYFLLNER